MPLRQPADHSGAAAPVREDADGQVPADLTAAGPRLARTRRGAIPVLTGLLTLQSLSMVVAGPVQLAGGHVPASAALAALLAPLGKTVTLVALATLCWTGGRSVEAFRVWVLAQLVGIVAQLLAPQADGTVLDLLVSLLVFSGLVVALRPRRRELLPRRGAATDRSARPSALAAAGVVVAAVGGVVLALRARGAVALTGVNADDLAEVRFDLAVTGVGLVAVAAWALGSRSRTTALLAGVGCLVTGVLCLARPHDWPHPGLLPAALLTLGGLAQLAAASRSDGRGTKTWG